MGGKRWQCQRGWPSRRIASDSGERIGDPCVMWEGHQVRKGGRTRVSLQRKAWCGAQLCWCTHTYQNDRARGVQQFKKQERIVVVANRAYIDDERRVVLSLQSLLRRPTTTVVHTTNLYVRAYTTNSRRNSYDDLKSCIIVGMDGYDD